jgi:hypothetical protein
MVSEGSVCGHLAPGAGGKHGSRKEGVADEVLHLMADRKREEREEGTRDQI